MIWSTWASTRRASGLSRPCVSEMMPIVKAIKASGRSTLSHVGPQRSIDEVRTFLKHHLCPDISRLSRLPPLARRELLRRRFLPRPLGRLLRCLRLRGGSGNAAAQRLHEVNHVLAARPLLWADGLARPLLVDQVNQRGLIVILEFLGVERARLLVDDVPREVEHVLGDLHVLDLVEVLLLGADLVGVAQQRTDETLLQRLERDD